MSLAVGVFLFWALFLGWLGYRWLVKKDLVTHKHEAGTAAFFLNVMSLVCWLVFG